jgi:hypothetical protein
MIFPFRPYAIEPNPAYSFDTIHRPVIPVRIGVGDGPRIPLFGLCDTGADDSSLTTSQAERLGIPPPRSRPLVFQSATGSTIGYFAEVTMELRQAPRSYVWKAQVAVFPGPSRPEDEDPTRVILGHTGFFRYFSVAFDFQRRRLRVRPNRLFVGLAR